MAVLRGKGMGLELALGGRDFEEALAELQSKLGERPGFYTGASAVAALGGTSITQDQLETLGALLNEHGIGLEVITGGLDLEPLATANGLRFVPQIDDGGEELARRRALRPKREVLLSDAARSLVADFAGARADIAHRRRMGEGSVRRVVLPEPPSLPKHESEAEAPAPLPSTLYHTGTLRGGQSLHNVGNIVVVGDVNPGAEIVASGDVLVFGRLAGVAHAGAQGDEAARVFALDLNATQLRIATFIAADAEDARRVRTVPEAALVHEGRIVVVPFDQIDQLQERGISSV